MPPENVPSPKQSFPENAWNPKILRTHPVFLPPAEVLPPVREFHFGNKIQAIPDHIRGSPLHIHTLHSVLQAVHPVFLILPPAFSSFSVFRNTIEVRQNPTAEMLPGDK